MKTIWQMKRNRTPMRKISVLKIDKDCYVPRSWIMDWVRLIVLPVCKNFGTEATYVRMSKSRKGLHFYIGISKPIHADLANRIQYLLGDDCRRVDFNRARIKVHYSGWDKLFEEENTRIIQLYHARFLQEHNQNLEGGGGERVNG
ncbi:MAG: hypothetical protein ABSF09_13805 [Candidatus Bathyarchaeia archaeon]|jgi:hypothetical protein